MTPYILFLIVVALAFDFVNGFHDAANSIATVVSTRVLSPRAAVVWAAFFNFVAFLVFPATVSAAIAKGVDLDVATDMNGIVLACLIGAITWNLITWYFGLPSSSSHALMGGFGGAALAHLPDLSVLHLEVFGKTVLFIVIAPVMGMVLGWAIMSGIRILCRNWRPSRVDRVFRRGQLVSAALYSLGHGGNDAQKTMGIITALLAANGLQPRAESMEPYLWVVLLCHLAMGLGTLSGGWRIVKTMGMKITKLRPAGGFAAETGGAMALASAIFLGAPVSTTHTITGSIMGSGAAYEGRLRAVKWGVAGRILWAWVLTIPAAGLIAAGSYLLIRLAQGG
jgi:PiT family inorganic phosphate transporter